MKAPKLLLLALLIAACDTVDSPDDRITELSGSYSITSFKSNIEVDLNNDGEASDELTLEIDSFGLNDLEIRPTLQQDNPTRLASFFFPKTWITFQYPGEPDGYVEFLDYGFGTTYELTETAFTLTDNQYTEQLSIDNVESNKEVSLTSNLNIIDTDHLSLSLTKEFYDFSSAQWISLDIEITYEKD